MLFAGYPILTYVTSTKFTNQAGFNLGGTNASGQIPDLPGNFGLIDRDTPKNAYTYKSTMDNEELVLVFSDEFNTDGRTFYPGDDPFWEAVDLHYWGTSNLEWYDPSQATTKDGNLVFRLDRFDDTSINHDMTYRSGMIQTWNKFCFTGGLIVGRAGYGATLEGTWPYTYDACDVGTLPNQTYPGERRPAAALENGDGKANGELSYLPGQRLSACTCPGESHPGPVRKNGEYVGRSAPEIDMFEATVTDGVGHVSLSAQFAPFNYPGTCFALYGFEYKPGFDDAYVTWINEVTAWTIRASAFVDDPLVEISSRPIPQEPMYIIANLGISEDFSVIDAENLQIPGIMLVDYIRVYQRQGEINVGCDPKDFPTAKYIET
ncbi:hypothetical protein NLJ89_g1151 [Agrocybe chaxingu]|uniref:GH16 domain-containing protein n=1 Tax=Agrocybe chaxingu TaxID=84603 RepID=A0A9W8N0M5_9AGAR|nr:hypothetical protein NLJ89_g1151 [Agrocybe chaxingu]